MKSNYEALAGGVSAFGGLGRDFGRLGGSFGRLGGSLVPPSSLSDGSGGTYSLNSDGLYVYSVDSSLWILCGDSDGAFGIDINGNYWGQAYP